MKKTMIERQNWHEFSQYHWRTIIRGQKLDYWPTSGKWSYQGRFYNGGLAKWLNDLKFTEQKPALKPKRKIDPDLYEEWKDTLIDAQELYCHNESVNTMMLINSLQRKINACEVINVTA